MSTATTDAARAALERDVRARCAAGDLAGAATAAIKGYGPELHGFLLALHRDEEDASEVFSVVAENLWRSLPKFEWRSSLRTWMYTVARHASQRFLEGARRRRRGVPISQEVSRLAAHVRTQTRAYLQTASKDAFARLRDELPVEDRALLVLRVDRDMAWDDLARVMLAGEGAAEIDESVVKREAARLRKRFQLVKEKLVERGREEGLLPGPGEG
jgi:RNA polymerase sigma-70 factor (ECF subfamily)